MLHNAVIGFAEPATWNTVNYYWDINLASCARYTWINNSDQKLEGIWGLDILVKVCTLNLNRLIYTLLPIKIAATHRSDRRCTINHIVCHRLVRDIGPSLKECIAAIYRLRRKFYYNNVTCLYNSWGFKCDLKIVFFIWNCYIALDGEGWPGICWHHFYK